MVLPLFFCPRLLSVICSTLPFVIRNSSFLIFLGVPLAASGFGSGYPLLLAAYKRLVLSLSSSLSVIRNLLRTAGRNL